MDPKLEWKQELLPALFSCAVLVVCLVVANPFGDSPFDDDWSYSHVALRLAETGHFLYNGWGSPTIVFQSLWGALWIHLLGFSFDLLRFATLPFSLGMIAVTYLLGRRIGLRRDMAAFGASCLAVAPLFLPLAASFMTEPYSGFFSLLCIYAAVSGADTTDRKAALWWLAVVAVAGILGGSNRQTVWAAPITLIPYLAWVRRSERRFLLSSVVAFAFVVGSLAFVVKNFSQKYSPLEISKHAMLRLAFDNAMPALHLILSLLLAGIMMCLPALLCFFPQWKRIPRKHVVALFFASLLVFDYMRSGLGDWGIVPFAGNILSERGILARWNDGLGFRPVIFGYWTRICLTYFLLISIIGATYLAVVSGQARSPIRFSRWMQVFSLFALSYLPFLIPGALLIIAFDRYVLPLLPLMILVILLPAQALVSRVPLAARVCLLLFATYGIITTHDYCASLRARSSAVREAERRGIPTDKISAGFERDGWEQLKLTGHIKTSLFGDPVRWDYNHFWFWFYVRAIEPNYVVIASSQAEAPRHAIASVPFTAWLTPFKRTMFVLPQVEVPKDQDY